MQGQLVYGEEVDSPTISAKVLGFSKAQINAVEDGRRPGAGRSYHVIQLPSIRPDTRILETPLTNVAELWSGRDVPVILDTHRTGELTYE
jgi:hypothetical protein